MADNDATRPLPENIEAQFPQELEVVREETNAENEVEKITTMVPLEVDHVGRGLLKGYPYLVPKVTEETFETIVSAFGLDFILGAVDRVFRMAAQKAMAFACEITEDKDKKVGEITSVDLAKWLTALATGQFRGETIKELKEQIERLQSETIALSKELVVNGQVNPQVATKLQHVAGKIAKMQEQIEQRRRNPSPVVDEDEGTE